MTKDEIMLKLSKMGTEQTKKTFIRHGAKEPLFGVKVADLKTIQKKVKKDYKLSLELFDTGNGDAMYLAGLIADETKMTKKDLNVWAKQSNWTMISEYTVAWIAAESNFGWELALEWIASPKETIASSGWSTLSSLVAINVDNDLNLDYIEKLLSKIEKEIHTAPNRVVYTMNGFIIAVGCYVTSLSEKARNTAKKIGVVVVNVGDTDCKVPEAISYIDKAIKSGKVGKKKKEARC